jgi:hypothetical protein
MAFVAAVPGIPGAAIYRVESLPTELLEGEALNAYTQAKPGELLFSIPGVARFRVHDGDTIEYQEENGADPGLVSLYLHGTARGALIHQRGELPLHAATLVPPGKETGLAICGPSGAGKSTLAIELVRRGWLLVADDTTRVTCEDGKLLAWPSRDTIKLWKDACEAGQIEISDQDRVAKKHGQILCAGAVTGLACSTWHSPGTHSRCQRRRSRRRREIGAFDAQYLPSRPDKAVGRRATACSHGQ